MIIPTYHFAALSSKIDSGTKLCGRFKPEQLNRTIRSSKGNTIKHKGVVVAAVALLSGIAPKLAQPQGPATVLKQPSEIMFGKIAVHSQQNPKEVT